MICWSCEKDAGGDMFCPSCGAIQPARAGLDQFAVVGLPRVYGLDVQELERRYKALSKKLHPDRFARADARARRVSLSRSVALNQAWRTLRDPVRRGEYLLGLFGIEVGGEEGTRRTGSEGKGERFPVPQALLLEVMELREALAEARAAGDQANIEALAADVGSRRSRALETVAAGFARTPPDLEGVAAALVEVRYFDRFLEEVAAFAEAREAAAELSSQNGRHHAS